MNSVAEVLNSVDLSDFSIYEGDCASVAGAIQHVFGGQFVASYSGEVEFHNCEPAHFAVRIDGDLYDGGGVTSEEALRDRAYYGVSEQDFDDIIVTEVNQADRTAIFDSSVMSQVIERLEAAK